LPGTPVARETRPPAAGPMLRYLSAPNSFGASGFSVLGASWAPTDVARHAAASAAKKFRLYDMPGVYHPDIVEML
jgi:hypothetical protein